MKTKSIYLGRGLHSKNWKTMIDNKESGLNKLLEIIRKDKYLVIQIREDYFNIYYKGGNLGKVGPRLGFQFDHNYFKGYEYPKYESDEKENLRKNKKKEWLGSLKETQDYQKFINKMKDLMDQYWHWLERVKHRSLTEKNVQHSLCVENSEDAEYTIIDLEFQVSTTSEYCYEKAETHPMGRFVAEGKENPRFDIIAVRNKDHKLCVIELKNGIHALEGKSGVGDHADSYEQSIGRNSEPFVKEMKNVIESKKSFKLLSDDFFIDDSVPEFIYAYQYEIGKGTKSKEEQKKFFKKIQSDNACIDYSVMFLDENDFLLSNKKIV
jgi:hypothetical protein